MRAYAPGKRMLWWGLTLAVVMFAAGCDGGLFGPCSPFTQVKAQIRMQGEPPANGLTLPLPVVLGNEVIGQATAIEQDSGPRTVLAVCLEKDALPRLHRLIGFYVEQDPAGARMIAAPLAETGPPIEKDPVFLGFFDYRDFFAWKAQYFLKKSLDSLLKTLDDALLQPGGNPPPQQERL